MPSKAEIQALNELFERDFLPLSNAVYEFAFRLTGDATQAEDIVQETYLKAWRFIGRYTEETNAKVWLFRICQQTFINEWRERKAQPYKVDYEDIVIYPHEDDFVPKLQASLNVKIGDQEMGNEVAKAINALSPSFRTVVLLDLQEFSYEEIASVLDLKIGTVRSRLYRARKILARQIAQFSEIYSQLAEPGTAYHTTGLPQSDMVLQSFPAIENSLNDEFQLMRLSNEGLKSEVLKLLITKYPYSSEEWARFLNLNPTAFNHLLSGNDPIEGATAERILKILQVSKSGEDVFGSKNKFYNWLHNNIPALGNLKPISLLGNTFGIELIQDELIRIEHGVLA